MAINACGALTRDPVLMPPTSPGTAPVHSGRYTGFRLASLRGGGKLPVMPHVPGLRSCYAKVGRLVYFGRMLDKIRLHAAGQLPAVYQANVGDGQFFVLDGRCCRFLGVRHADLRERVLAGTTDEEVLAWAHAHGTPRTDEECHMWNRFIVKLGWRDERSAVLPQRIIDSGLTGKVVETLVDHIEYDEGRDPVATQAWDSV
jgi:gluconokinase